MKDQKKLMIGVGLAVLIIIVGVVAAGGMKKDTTNSTATKVASGHTGVSTKNSSSAQSNSGTAVAATAVQIKDYMFAPMSIKVKVGDTVTWTNMDSVHHNVVADKPSADAPNGPLIGQGETYSFKFTKAGTYTFHCDPHPYMHGTVVVE